MDSMAAEVCEGLQADCGIGGLTRTKPVTKVVERHGIRFMPYARLHSCMSDYPETTIGVTCISATTLVRPNPMPDHCCCRLRVSPAAKVLETPTLSSVRLHEHDQAEVEGLL